MATQRTPRSFDEMLKLLMQAANGARRVGADVGLKHNTEAAIRADIEALTGTGDPNQPGLKPIWNRARSQKVAGTADFRNACIQGRKIALACVGVLKPRLGQKWNSAWGTAGFGNGSLAIPRNPLTTLQQLRIYFAGHPECEVAGLAPGIDATAAACEAAARAITRASSASNESVAAAALARTNFLAAMQAARRRLIGLRQELAQLMPPDDPRWYEFGLPRPADPRTPEVPANLSVTAGAVGSGNCFCDWDNSVRAESYRARILHGTTEVAQHLGRESEAHFSGLPLDVPLTLEVSAINEAGESRAATGGVFTLAGIQDELAVAERAAAFQ